MTSEDILDISLEIEKKQIGKFALNYRALVKNKWVPIYRVDNFHGFLHEQRLWRTKEPIPLDDEEYYTRNDVVDRYIDQISNNFQKYKSYYKESSNKKKKK